jgi:hypothetical protein
MTRVSDTTNIRHSVGAGTPSEAANSDHESAVLRAEVRRLVRALRPYGVLRRDALARAACAETWHEAGFERALQLAVAHHEIEQLALDFYRLPHSGSPDTASTSTHQPAA